GLRSVLFCPEIPILIWICSPKKGEDALLFAKNKWLVAHPDSGLEEQGAWMGLKGR
ncbi:hypothetical protein LEA_16631, partial [human gut metagenome]